MIYTYIFVAYLYWRKKNKYTVAHDDAPIGASSYVLFDMSLSTTLLICVFLDEFCDAVYGKHDEQYFSEETRHGVLHLDGLVLLHSWGLVLLSIYICTVTYSNAMWHAAAIPIITGPTNTFGPSKMAMFVFARTTPPAAPNQYANIIA